MKLIGLISLMMLSLYAKLNGQTCEIGGFIENPGFESAYPLSPSPYTFVTTAPPDIQNWYYVGSSPEIMQTGSLGVDAPLSNALEGNICVGLLGRGSDREGFATLLTKTLDIGEEYILSYWATSKDKYKIEAYLFDGDTKMSIDDRKDYECIARTKASNKEWKKFEFRFTAEKAYVQFMIFSKKKYVLVDDIQLRKVVRGCCESNMLRYASFEEDNILQADSYWQPIDYDCNSWRQKDNSFLSESPVSSANTGDAWIFLCSRTGNAVFGSNNTNAAITAKLRYPMVAGQYYKISFYGATKNPFLIGRAKISIKLWTSSFCSSAICTNSDWNASIGGTPVINNFKLKGDPKTWHYYEQSFLADKDYEYVVIQSKDGSNPALDDICISAADYLDDVQKPILYYNVHNATRQLNADKSSFTVHYRNNLNLFGLSKTPQALILSDNAADVMSLEPKYTTHQINPRDLIVDNPLATDVVLDGNGKGYVAMNYKVYRIEDIAALDPQNNLTQLPLSSQLSNPFSLALSGDYLFIMGVDKLSVFNLVSGRQAIIQGHAIRMGAYMRFDDQGNLFIADPGDDSIKKIGAASITQIKTDLDNAVSSITISSQILSQGNELSGVLSPNPDYLIRGPIGIDVKGQDLWVSVDKGTNIPGSILKINKNTGSQSLFVGNIPGPRGIRVN